MRSQFDDAKTILRCLNSGADDFISKKSDQGELCLRLYNSFKLVQTKRNPNSAFTYDPARQIRGHIPVGQP